MSDDPHRLSPEDLRRYRLTLVPPGDPRHLLLAQEVADFVISDVLPAAPADQYLGAVFVDDLASPIAWNLACLGYLGNHKVEPGSFLIPGMLLGASGMVLFHQRGSLLPAPARREVRVARRVLRSGEAARVQLLDYLVFSGRRWVSLKDAGKIRFPALGASAPPDGRAKVKPKYRNPEHPQQTWSGRGQMARWLRRKLAAGAGLEDFAVED